MSHCWNCQRELDPAAFCPTCGKLQPRKAGATLFDVFSLRPAVQLDVLALEARFRELSLKLHPDRFVGQDARERRYSLEQTTALNEAYRTLKDTTRRAFYLLKLQGLDLEREDGSTQKGMPLEFLEEVMELRETLEGFKARGDLSGALALGESVQSRRSEALGAAQVALARRLEDAQNAAALDEAAHALARVRYFTRFLEDVERMEEEALT